MGLGFSCRLSPLSFNDSLSQKYENNPNSANLHPPLAGSHLTASLHFSPFSLTSNPPFNCFFLVFYIILFLYSPCLLYLLLQSIFKIKIKNLYVLFKKKKYWYIFIIPLHFFSVLWNILMINQGLCGRPNKRYLTMKFLQFKGKTTVWCPPWGLRVSWAIPLFDMSSSEGKIR